MRSYSHFTTEERQCLLKMLSENKSNSEIALALGKHRSSIGREIKRNRNKDKSYNPWRATILYILRRKKCVRKLRIADGKVRSFVIDALKRFWSPEIISARWKAAGGNGLAHSTIYRALKAKKLDGFTPKTHLRRHGKRKNQHNSQTIQPEHTIHDRPAEVENRERLGDFEGDTVFGGVGKGAVVTLVDRKSRFLYAERILNRNSDVVRDAFRTALDGVSVNSITLDNGSEFAKFAEIEEQHKTTVYFADPHSPWQRGSNENLNGLLRFFFPKGTDFRAVSDAELQSVVALINDRPRKCLGWLSPKEFLSCLCCT